jgi:YD repeat-containing protein
LEPDCEFGGAGNFQAWNIYGARTDEILARWVAGVGNLSYHSDKNGNVTALLDDSGNVVEKYTYDAFGQPTIPTGPALRT